MGISSGGSNDTITLPSIFVSEYSSMVFDTSTIDGTVIKSLKVPRFGDDDSKIHLKVTYANGHIDDLEPEIYADSSSAGIYWKKMVQKFLAQ